MEQCRCGNVYLAKHKIKLCASCVYTLDSKIAELEKAIESYQKYIKALESENRIDYAFEKGN